MVNVLKNAGAVDLPTLIVQYRTQGNNAISAHHTHQFADETISDAVERALECARQEHSSDIVLAGVQRFEAHPVRVRSEREITVDMISTLSQALVAVSDEKYRHEAGDSVEKPLYTTCLSINAAIKQLTSKL